MMKLESYEEIDNAMVKTVSLGYEDHGILTAWVFLDGAGWSQAFGGYDLRRGTEAADFVLGCLQALKVEHWEDLVGKPCRVIRQHGLLVALGHFVEDSWYKRAKVGKGTDE